MAGISFPRIGQYKYVNENDKCLIDFFLISDLKGLHGKIGIYIQIGKFTCVTSWGLSVMLLYYDLNVHN